MKIIQTDTRAKGLSVGITKEDIVDSVKTALYTHRNGNQ